MLHSSCRNNPWKDREAAFTITELLAACAILALLSLILFSALNQVTNVINLAQGKSTTYQDVRTVTEQLSRELQQAIPYSQSPLTAGYASFVANGSQLHFVAIIDNDKGQEEVEVHYAWDGSNSLYKAVIPYDVSSPPPGGPYWDIDANNWTNSPAITLSPTNTTGYVNVLDGVKSFSFEIWTNSTDTPYPPNGAPGKIASGQWFTNFPPAYLKVNLQIYDSHVIRRWGSAANVAVAQTNLVRPFHVLICFPRGNE